jgi:two-component system, OmpR family, response regulator
MGRSAQSRVTLPIDPVDRVIATGDVVSPDMVVLCEELRRSSIEAEHLTVAEIRADVSSRPAPSCLVVDLRHGPEAKRFLDAYCHSVSRHVLVVTSPDDVDGRLHALELGVVDDLVAPIDLREALARVRRVMRRAQESRSTRVVSGDLVVDFATRTVLRRGEPIELTGREMSVLFALARATPRVVSKRQLLEQVWSGAERTPNLVEATVSSLRRKLDQRGSRIIQTVHGVGYAFRPTMASQERVPLGAERERLVRERDEIIARRDRVIVQLREQLDEARRRSRVLPRRSAEPAGTRTRPTIDPGEASHRERRRAAHDHAADAHDRAADAHEQAALLYDGFGLAERAASEREKAALERREAEDERKIALEDARGLD